MVNSAKPPTEPPLSDPAIEGGVGDGRGTPAEAVTASLGVHHGTPSSLPSTLKTCGSQGLLRSTPVNRVGEAVAPTMGTSSQDLDEVNQRLQLGLDEVTAAPGVGKPAEHESPNVAEAVSSRPLKAHTHRRPAMSSQAEVVSMSALPQASERKRRSVRADALDRPRFSVTLSAEEIEEDIYALTGALPRSRPRHRPPVVQNQLNCYFPARGYRRSTRSPTGCRMITESLNSPSIVAQQ
ncbi:hypothetical protein CFC21_000568 [Triticum aestivum]|uniref:Uncharacterized protein n=1 Tax=Triticum aestivum TaxID=4565 RepID=A0A3B5XVH8_WHEAT|nr:uncharacterized protein LOC123082575 [Triticum aestivum]KAF6982138.1 hypothetical protein CFC21_000568 [Triticum aestivum]